MAKFVVNVGWDDVPHLDEQAKHDLGESYPPHERDARMKGIPALGSGAIYPVPEDTYLIEPFRLPISWQRSFALDVGWNKTAALWGAWDYETETVYLYDEHYQSHGEPSVHASAILRRGEWIRGVIDPASMGANQRDGRTLFSEYQRLGLDLTTADNSVEAGIHRVWEALSQGRIKIFRTLTNTLSEIRIYRRDDRGRVVKERDHLMDCLRYLIATGPNVASYSPDAEYEGDAYMAAQSRNSVTGY